MSLALWVIIGAAVIAVGLTYVIATVKGYDRGYANGYAAGQQAERRVMNQMISKLRQQGFAAKRDIDYLYERARRQVSELSLRCIRPSGRACSRSTEGWPTVRSSQWPMGQ